jgi:NAD(P)-dependent dehydrogenase (short-subunit alcohol dehydrogenase family)
MGITVITGANRGIGLELARQLLKKGHHVVAAVRQTSRELDALGVQVREGVDVADGSSVTRFFESLGEESIELLINNAGILRRSNLQNLDYDDIEEQFRVNAIGPLRCTLAALPRLQPGSKVAVVTSRMGSIEDNTSGGAYGYRMSKSAVNSAFKSLSLDLASRDISVAILHPGWVKTDMTNNTGLVDTVESAAGLIERIDQLTASTSGSFWHMNGDRLPW